MSKTTGISIRVDAELKKQSEEVMAQFGLNMTTTVSMFLHQIVREQAIPLSLSLSKNDHLREDLIFSQWERMAGYQGLSGDEVAAKMEQIITRAEHEENK